MTGSIGLIIGLGAVFCALLLGAVLLAGGGADRVQHALAAIETQYGRRVTAARPEDSRALSPLLQRLRAVALRLSPAGGLATLRRRLDRAGNPTRWTAERVLAYKGVGLVAFGLLGVLLGLHRPATLVLLGGGAAAAGFFLPDLLLYNAGIKRQDRVRKALPDTLDMLTVCVEAGLGFDAALAQVARNTVGPLAAECARVLQEMQFGSSRTEALRGLADRSTVAELRVFVSALMQASELGVPVARVLREQSHEMRIRRRQRAEELAQKVPVKILFPLIFFLFPALFVIIIGPGAISIMHNLMHR